MNEKFCYENIIGESREIKETIEIARKVAQTDVPVLLIGETGVGKKFFAKSIHNESSRRGFPFVSINCSVNDSELLESEMFGYKAVNGSDNIKGMLEEANSGTVLFDEIGDLDSGLQAKLLEVFETKSFIKPGDILPTEVDVRILSATSRNLEQDIETNKFRRDLYYRIGVVRIEIPPLRNRIEDIEPFTRFFIKDFSIKMNRTINHIEKDFLDRLKRYSFPGNIRELRNVIERAIILTDGEVLKVSSLPKEFFKEKTTANQAIQSSTLDEIEKQHILKVLHQTNGNKTRTAEILGIGLTTLYRKLQSYSIE